MQKPRVPMRQESLGQDPGNGFTSSPATSLGPSAAQPDETSQQRNLPAREVSGAAGSSVSGGALWHAVATRSDDTVKPFNIVRWRMGGLTYIAVSDVEAAQLLAFVRLVESG
jgi:hypothetical protein